jgi:hypothetical protein
MLFFQPPVASPRLGPDIPALSCSRTLLTYIHLLGQELSFDTHKKQQAKV